MEVVERLNIQRVDKDGKRDIEDIIIREMPLTLILNNRELVTLLCTPADLKYLAIGFLSSEGLLKSKDDVKKVIVDEKRGVVRVETEGDKEFDSELLFKRLITSGCGRGASFYSAADAQGQVKVESQTLTSPSEVFALVKEFQHRSEIYRLTGGVHSAALCNNREIVIFTSDIGRHNAIDKIFGQCILGDIPTDNHMIITSGRISSEILLKVANSGIPILISKSAPTNMGVRLANDLGVTLIGFVRGRRMNIYANGWRVKDDGE